MPHAAFQGQTPNEVFFGIADDVPKKLADARKTATQETDEGEPIGGMRHMRLGDEFGGVAIATAAVQNVVRRSWDAPQCLPEA